MLSLVDPETLNAAEQEKQAILNRIIAAGINSLSASVTNYNSTATTPDRQLLDTFMSQSFDKILACWPMLDERVKFHIFKSHITEFENFMKDKVKESR